MTKITLQIKGLDNLVKRLDNYNKNLEAKLADAIQETASNLAGLAKRNCSPWATGDLFRSIQPVNEGDPLTWFVRVDTPYAAYVEFGTGQGFQPMDEDEWMEFAALFKGANQDHKGMEARPFLYPAFKEIEPLFKKDMINVLKEFK